MKRIVVLSGGVGGARLVEGIARAAEAGEVTVVVNTGDDFDHWGLRICPDVDTVLYHLSGDVDFERGWGVAGDSTRALDRVAQLGGPAWFMLGDRDLGTHIARTEALRGGATLTDVTRAQARTMGAFVDVLPMCDHPAPTQIDAGAAELVAFQDWFVRDRCQPRARRVVVSGGRPSTAVIDALDAADACIIAPSNPFVSIEPILALDGVRERLAALPTVAVSPIIGGRAVKGPLAQMLRDLARVEPSPGAVFARYPRVDVALVHPADPHEHGFACRAVDIFMRDADDRLRVGRAALDAARDLGRG